MNDTIETRRSAAPENDTTRVVLPNGLPVIEMPMGGRLATTILIAFPAGARYEQRQEVGAAHFLEHMAFRGTVNYPTTRVLNRTAERMGTELDASTMDDYVEFSAVVRAQSAMDTIDLLTDISGRPRLHHDHLETERAAILQEVADNRDEPGTAADERLIAALFRGHRLAASTIGGAADVQRLTRAHLLSFRERHWSPEGGVAVIAGNLAHLDRVLMHELLLRIAARPAPPAPPSLVPFVRRLEVEERDSEVVHLRLAYAVPGLDLTLPGVRAVADVYSDLLGGPMGSRLYEEIREQRGLCYSIGASVWGYPGTAMLSVGCSVQASNIAETYERINAIVADLHDHGPTEEEWLRARSFGAGAQALSYESTASRADHAVQLVMEYGDHDVDPMLHLRAIESVTRQQLAELAARVAPGPCVGCVGPVTAAAFA